MTRLTLLLLVALAIAPASCSAPAPTLPSLPLLPMRYDYLPKLGLNVASIDISADLPPSPPGDVAPLAPEPATTALRQMAQDRLVANGSAGRAVFTIESASIIRTPDDTLTGNLAVRLDISVGTGTPTAYAEARVSRITPLNDNPLRPALDLMTHQMLDDMNVEFEYQIRHSLKDWLQSAAPAPVVSAPLPPP